jgi:hypothetical protein
MSRKKTVLRAYFPIPPAIPMIKKLVPTIRAKIINDFKKDALNIATL